MQCLISLIFSKPAGILSIFCLFPLLLIFYFNLKEKAAGDDKEKGSPLGVMLLSHLFVDVTIFVQQMASNSVKNTFNQTRDMASSNETVARSSESAKLADQLSSQRLMSDSRMPTTCCVLFEGASRAHRNKIYFTNYQGTRARNHHRRQLHLAQVEQPDPDCADQTYEEFTSCVKRVIDSIGQDDLTSYVVSIRTGVSYFFSKAFRFYQTYEIDEIDALIQKKIPHSDLHYYKQRNYSNHESDDSLHSSFSNVKPISGTREFVEKLQNYNFHVSTQKYVFRVYLQSPDKQTHVCTVDPSLNYAIIEFSKDFHRICNIDYIRDRSASKFKYARTYDDIFDYRIQFQYNPRTNGQSKTIEEELCEQFPSLNQHFKNEFILQPLSHGGVNDDQNYAVIEELCPYVQFIRRDFGDVYQYNGDDQLFKNFTIFLESSVEYKIDREQCTCKPELDSHGIVYARLDLKTMVSSPDNQSLDVEFLISKLWDMGEGLTRIAGECTTSETQQSTNYYTSNGSNFTAHDEAIVQRITSQSNLYSMLGLSNRASNHEINTTFERICDELNSKWECFAYGIDAKAKLEEYYRQYQSDQQFSFLETNKHYSRKINPPRIVDSVENSVDFSGRNLNRSVATNAPAAAASTTE